MKQLVLLALATAALSALGQTTQAPETAPAPVVIDGISQGDLNLNIIQFEQHGTVTVVGPTQTGQPGTSVTTYNGVSAGRQVAANAAGAAAGVGIAVGVTVGTTAIERAIVKHQGPDKNYKDAVRHCGQRYIAKVGAFNVHADQMRLVLDQCKIDAAQEFPTK